MQESDKVGGSDGDPRVTTSELSVILVAAAATTLTVGAFYLMKFFSSGNSLSALAVAAAFAAVVSAVMAIALAVAPKTKRFLWVALFFVATSASLVHSCWLLDLDQTAALATFLGACLVSMIGLAVEVRRRPRLNDGHRWLWFGLFCGVVQAVEFGAVIWAINLGI